MDIKWKPMPKSFPDQRPGHEAADLNGFFDTRDTELAANKPLRREESFAESTHSDSEPQHQFNKLRKARDSIFVTRAHLGNDSDEEEEEVEEQQHNVQTEGDSVIRRPTSNLINKSENARKSRVSVRFSDIPEASNEGASGGYTNPKFVDDHGNVPQDLNDNSQMNRAEWQRNSDETDEVLEHWAVHSSDEDDDE